MEILVLQTMHQDSEFRIPPKWTLGGKMIMMPEFVDMTSSLNFFNVVMFYLSSFVSKFHFIIVTGFRVMTIFVYKGLSRNPEYRNNRLWIFPYNWALKCANNSKFSANISTKKLLTL